MSHSACDIWTYVATNHHSSFTSVIFQFAEKFQEVKEAAKLARDKSQEKAETLSNHSQVNYIFLLSAIQIQYIFAVQLFPVVAVVLYRQ